MNAYFNLKSDNFVNLNAIVLLTLACATKGRVYYCASTFDNCGLNFDKAFAAAIETVKVELTRNGVLTAQDLKALDTAAFHMTCAVYDSFCEDTEEEMVDYMMRSIKRTLKYEPTAKESAFANKFLLRETKGYSLDIAELLSYAIAVATNDRVYNKPLVYGVLRNKKVSYRAHGLSAQTIATIKDLGKVMAKSLKNKGLILQEEVKAVEQAVAIVLDSAKRAYDRYLEWAPADIDVLAFSDCFMWHMTSQSVVLGSGVEKASRPYNFHDFDDWF